jgi:RNA polymerase sigma-70 factor (ECF subfamily)
MRTGKDGRAEPTDVELMLRVRRGDAEAFSRLYRRYNRKLLNFFYAMGAGPSYSEDLCQETLLRLWRLRARYEPRGSFPAYLFAVARFVWMERRTEVYRASASRPEFDADSEAAAPGSEPDALASRSEAAEAIAKAVAELPEEQRMAFVLRAVQGMPLDEIAEAMDCPINTVRSRKLLAVRKLREVLRGLLTL